MCTYVSVHICTYYIVLYAIDYTCTLLRASVCIDETLDLGYIRVAGLHRGCKPVVLFDLPNFCPRTMTHVHIRTYVHTY